MHVYVPGKLTSNTTRYDTAQRMHLAKVLTAIV